MPVTYIPSAEQLIDRQKFTAKKRRRNQNTEIDELAKLLPVKPLPIRPTIGSTLDLLEGAGWRDKTQAMDKITVLRITSTFLKFQEFIKKGPFSLLNGEDKVSTDNERIEIPTDLMSEAIDGFLLVLDKDATILFASESITSYLGLAQHDVIGQNLADVTHPDDKEIINDNLVPKPALPPGVINKDKDTQPRQFYIRFKSTMSPGRLQLSRSSSFTRVQVTGNLKLYMSDTGTRSEKDVGTELEQEVVGFVGECRLIEHPVPILEISIPQSYFTTTISLTMKIVAVESQMKDLIGYSTEDFIGTRLGDYFHPADYTKLLPCEVLLMHTGHAVSPLFRFMSADGSWVWMQMEGTLRYKPGTLERQFWEVKVKMVSQDGGHLAFIEQNELYTSNPDPNQDFLNPHKDRSFLSRLSDQNQLCSSNEGAKPIIKSLKGAQLPEGVLDSVLHGREMGLNYLTGNVKRVLHPNQADAFKARLMGNTWDKPNPPLLSSPPSSVVSPPSELSSITSESVTSLYPGRGCVQSDFSLNSPLSSTPFFPHVQNISFYSQVSNSHSPASSAMHATPISTSTPSSSISQDLISIKSISSPTPSAMDVVSNFTSCLTPLLSSDSAADLNSFLPIGNVTATAEDTSINFIPRFSSIPFQDQVVIPNTHEIESTFDVTYVPHSIDTLPEIDDQDLKTFMASTTLDNSIPNPHDQNQNGDILEQLLQDVGEMDNPPDISPQSDTIRYYNSSNPVAIGTASSGPSSHVVSGDVTVSEVGQYIEQNGGAVDSSNSDLIEILAQFS